MASERDDGSSGAAGNAGGQSDRDLAQPTVVSAAVATPTADQGSSSATDSVNQSSHSATTHPDLAGGRPQIVATLTAIDGDLKGEAFVLRAGENHLGRGVECSPVLNSRWISRSHATIQCDNGQMTIRATEGKELAVNDVTTTAQALHDGDLIRLGTTVLILRTVTADEIAPSSVIRVATEGSGEQQIPAAVASESSRAQNVPPPARRRKSWWKFWVKPAPSLLFIRGNRTGERVELTGARVRIGGLQENEIVISGNDASRNHAELRVRDGRVHIWDLRSVNGTWVNEERIENKELRFGDVIRIGSEELRFED